jgi:NADH-quinone oxidoreductase subunit I
MRYFIDIITGGWSLVTGMGVTISNFFKPVVTVQYPRETIDISPMYRGHIKLVGEPGNPERTKCFVCLLCQKNCPSSCIEIIEGEKPEGATKKVATKYILDYSKCSHCGICVDSCPVDALEFSSDYNSVGFSREDSRYDLVKEYEKRLKK